MSGIFIYDEIVQVGDAAFRLLVDRAGDIDLVVDMAGETFSHQFRLTGEPGEFGELAAMLAVVPEVATKLARAVEVTSQLAAPQDPDDWAKTEALLRSWEEEVTGG